MTKLDDLLIKSANFNDERFQQLKKLYPELIMDGDQINLQELKKLFAGSSVVEKEKFGFSWYGKAEAKRKAYTPSKATLIHDEEISVNPELSDGNIFIEGENLEVCFASNKFRRLQ